MTLNGHLRRTRPSVETPTARRVIDAEAQFVRDDASDLLAETRTSELVVLEDGAAGFA